MLYIDSSRTKHKELLMAGVVMLLVAAFVAILLFQ
jgi:hypothetical protein